MMIDQRECQHASRFSSGPPFTRDWTRPCGRICVFDLETAPDRHAQVLSGRHSGGPRGSPLHEIVAASVLIFEEGATNEFGRFDLRSFHHQRRSERGLLINVLAELDRLTPDGTLVTFNGRGFDMPMLWLRQMRWWLCDRDAVPRIDAAADIHVDVMLELSLGGSGRWPTLSDACASFGYCLNGSISIGGEPRLSPQVRKCERDVVGTTLLFLHVLAARRRSSAPLEAGIPAVGAYLRQVAGGRPHLEQIALSVVPHGRAQAWEG